MFQVDKRRQSITFTKAQYSENWFTGLIEPLCLLPVQYSTRRHDRVEGEFRLLCAVLQDALLRYFHCRGRKTHHMRIEFLEVKRWFEERHRSDFFSFESVCEALGIDCELLRTFLQQSSRELSKLDFEDNSITHREIAKVHRVLQPTRRRASSRR
jgi:hypothetical protein